MSSNETTDNNEQVTIEEIDDFPIRQVPYNNEPQGGLVSDANIGHTNAPLNFSGGYATNTVNAFGGPPSSTVAGAFGGPPASTVASAFGGLRLATTVGVSSSSNPGFGFRTGPNPNPLPAPQAGMAFGFCGGPPRPVERHPETGQPLHGLRSACGGIQNSHPGSSQNQHMGGLLGGIKPFEDKKKHIENIYIKLAEARTKIAELNKFLDDIYETLPKIQ